jgi:D-alanyl-D-alanine carboxypeptidase/D-alanyl-D-alanine-endopeptidase (penicillin-binding protein 4)
MTRTLVPSAFALLVLSVSATLALLGAAPAPIVQPALGGAPWTDDAIVKLDAELEAMLATSPALRGAHYGVLAIDTATGNVLYDHAADSEFQPASTLKLLVGSAALEKLGAAYRFRTELADLDRDGAPIAGAFILVAGGDPTLATANLREAASALAALRLGSVSIAVDASRYDAKPYADGWTWDDFGQPYAPKISAMTLDENVVSLRVAPGAAPGASAVVYFKDPLRPFAPADPCHPENVSLAVTGPPNSDDTIDVVRRSDGCIDVVGSIPFGAPEEPIGAALEDPVFNASETLANALRAENVVVGPSPASSVPGASGASGALTYSAGRAGWVHDSEPLGALLGPRFWIPSDNLFAELLLKELGHASGAATATTADGIASETRWLQSIGVGPATVTLADGCGMSQYDRITPRDLVAILQHDWNGPNRQLVLDSLPVGGARGTIEGISGSSAAGRVFAKTGSMRHVRGLAGYLATKRHGAVTFAFNVDDWNGDYPSLAALRAQVLSRIVDDGM